jgi:hypothetical protein
MKVDRENLLRALESVRGALSPIETVAQSDCFAFRDSRVLTFNGEVSASAPCPLKGITGALKAAPFLEMIRRFPDKMLDVTKANDKLKIKGQRRSYTPALQSEIDEAFGAIGTVERWQPLHADFCDAVNMVAAVTTDDVNTKFNTTCVHVHPNYVEAHEEIQICRWNLETGFGEESLLRASGMKAVPVLGMTEWGETERWMVFRNPDGTELACSKFMLDDYSDLNDPLNDFELVSKVSFPKMLIEVIDRAGLLTKERGRGRDHVLVELTKGAIKVTGSGVSGEIREKKGVAWDGPDLSFYTLPKVFAEVLKRSSEVELSTQMLRIGGGSSPWTYQLCLQVPEDLDGAGKEEEVSDAEE